MALNHGQQEEMMGKLMDTASQSVKESKKL
jgi:hypothetical protein